MIWTPLCTAGTRL